jgi:molybdenum cofactor cytidylyltransferase
MSLAGVVLAAGQSSRMGRQKLLLPYGGTTVVRRIVDELFAAGLDRVIAVTGHDAEAVAEALEGSGAEIARNPLPERGMLSSAQCGVAAAPNASGWLIALGDQPGLRSPIARVLAERHAAAPEGILVPVIDGRRGHPILVPGAFRDELLGNRFANEGLRGLFRAYPDSVTEVVVKDDWILRDMDYPADYRRELEQLDADQ